MPKITFIQPDGTPVTVEDAEGSAMEIALANGVEGIDGNCGGVCSCSTCHVRVRPEWAERVGKPNAVEQDLLDMESKAGAGSRLACQIELTADLDGLVVDVVKL